MISPIWWECPVCKAEAGIRCTSDPYDKDICWSRAQYQGMHLARIDLASNDSKNIQVSKALGGEEP